MDEPSRQAEKDQSGEAELALAEKTKQKRKWTPFRELSKTDKVLRIVALCLEAAVFLCCLITAIYYMLTVDPNSRIGPALRMAAVALLPIIVELISRRRLSNVLMIVLFTFCFFAGYLGATLNFWHIFPAYDDIMHGLFGYIGCVIGLYLLCVSRNAEKMNGFGIWLCAFCISMTCEAVWEVFEFFNDNVLGGNAQGPLIEGILNGETVFYRWVNDTMSDIIMNMIGAAVFSLHYLLHRLTRKDLFIGTMIKDFSR